MEVTAIELQEKEVIDISEGTRYGYVGDLRIDLETGKIHGLVIPGRLRFFGLLGREEDVVFPWNSVCRFGDDIILVKGHQVRQNQRRFRR